MLPIIYAALCVVVISAESSSINSYSSGPNSSRDFEYTGGSYSSGKPSYSDLGSASFITAAASPYSKSDSRFASDSSTDSGEPRTSLTNSFYKSKYGSEAVVNALRPTSGSSSSSASSSATSDQATDQYEYPSGASATYYESNNGGAQLSGSPVNEYPGSYASISYGERGPPEHHRQPSEYTHTRPVYNGYPGLGDYAQVRPTSYSHGGISSPVASVLSSGEYPGSPHHHHHQHREYPHSYKTYITSSGNGSGGSGSSTKYQTVFGALKNLFSSGGSSLMPDAAPSAAHVPTYYSSNAMHAAAHHTPTYSQPPSAGLGYYFSSGPGVSSSGSSYSKNYPPMRFMTSSGNPGNKIIVIRDSGSTHSTGYPTSGGSILGSSSSYPTKSKIANFAPSATGGHAYLSNSPSSLQGYTSGALSNGYLGGYSSSGNFAAGHGGSTFLGYST